MCTGSTYYRRGIIWIIWLLCTNTSRSQLPMDLKITHFDGAMGLYSRVVSSLVKDTEGFVWIGTSDGLYRYDGYTFINYRKQPNDTGSLPDNHIQQLALGKDHKIWIGLANKGVGCFDPATGKFRHFPLPDTKDAAAAEVTMLLVDQSNEVWLGLREKGIWHLNPHTGKYTGYDRLSENASREIPVTVGAAVEYQPGILYLGTSNGLYRMTTSDGSVQRIGNPVVDQKKFRDDDFISMTLDGNLLWLGAWAGGLSCYDLQTKQWKNYKLNYREPEKFTTNIVSGIRVKSAEELWITSNDRGLGVFNKRTTRFQFYTQTGNHTTLPDNLCFKIETDDPDNLWLIHEWGLTRIQVRRNGFRFTPVPVTKSDNLSYYYIRDLLDDPNRRFIATTLADGLHVISKKTGMEKQFPVKVFPDEEPFLAVNKLMKDSRGITWIITRDYIYQYDTVLGKPVLISQPSVFPLQKGSNHYNNITEDTRGNIWISSSRNGVFVYNRKSGSYRHFYPTGKEAGFLPLNVITALVVDHRGRVWLGSMEGGMMYFDSLQQRFMPFETGPDKKQKITRAGSLLADAGGYIWSGTDQGLLQIDASRESPVLKRAYTAEDGVRGDYAYALQQDASGKIWCVTSSALCSIEPVTQRVRSIGLQDDVMKTIVNKVALSHIHNQVALLSYGGYYLFDPGVLEKKEHGSGLRITSFKVRDREYYYQPDLSNKGRVQLSPSDNLFSFEFAVLDFAQSDNHRYAYWLEGFDKTWINAGNRRYAGYTNIPGGDYIFHVKTLNTEGESKPYEISIPIRIITPLYKSTWVILLFLGLVVLGLYGFYRYRLNHEREILLLQTKAQTLEKEKTRVQYENLKQQLNPHFLFNSLSSLSSLIRIDKKMAGEFLDGMSKIYRYILQSKDNELVSLKDEIRFVQTFIALQKTRFEEGLQIQISIDDDRLTKKIVPVTLQNLIENAIKHNIIDLETPLVIQIFTEGDYLVMRNNLQKKSFVDTSNRQGLHSLLSLYKYLSDLPMLIEENAEYYTVKIPLI